MQLIFTTALIALISSASFTSAKVCSGLLGECVVYYHGANCEDSGFISDYVPTCKGNCFQYSSFDSVNVNGNGLFGTDCHMYSDANCENEIANTGNNVAVLGTCTNSQGAQSMKCYYNC
ncbi:hypothetical protein K438DRAFT_1592426 [Mycena galopus ATCC 62051]|nr:hypothetical protein K438DRAFT_1592426 [Mycena galopus ATCC 62051]